MSYLSLKTAIEILFAIKYILYSQIYSCGRTVKIKNPYQ